MANLPPSVEAMAARNLRSHIERIAGELELHAARLRDLAGDVDRVGHAPGHDGYAPIAGRAQNGLMNLLLPNLGLGTLATLAAQADVARAKGE